MAKIYISSTFEDLIEAREAVALVIRNLGHDAIMMEKYEASTLPPVEKCLADVKSCDAYVGIFAWRYGFIPKGYDKSITHLEYKAAREAAIPCFIFLVDKNASWPVIQISRDKESKKIDNLRLCLQEESIVKFFSNTNQLKSFVKESIKKNVEIDQFADLGKKKGKRAVITAFILIFIFLLWNEIVGPGISKYLVSEDVNRLIRSHCWITYTARNFTPGETPYPDINSIKKELAWVKKAGFTGIITFSSDGTFSKVPELAKELGFSVIMGVWNPNDPQEISTAIRKQKYSDAYCVGHNGLNRNYSYDELVKTVNRIRFFTRRPVSTTEKIASYLSDERLFKLGSWVFPDAHVSVKSENRISFWADALRDAAETISLANKIAGHKGRGHEPILLKMVTYPMDGISNASLDEQARFYVFILESLRDSQPEIHSDVSISVHSSFDAPWKRFFPFYDWDPYTGLFDDSGNPRPAVKEIVGRLR